MSIDNHLCNYCKGIPPRKINSKFAREILVVISTKYQMEVPDDYLDRTAPCFASYIAKVYIYIYLFPSSFVS
jgi:hypothetical protein